MQVRELRERAVGHHPRSLLDHFPEVDADGVLDRPFIKVVPKDVRPYGRMYAH